MLNNAEQIPEFVLTTHFTEDRRAVLSIDEDACDAIFSKLRQSDWQIDMFKTTQEFNPLYHAMAMIRQRFFEEHPNSHPKEIELDERSREIAGAVFGLHFNQLMLDQTSNYLAEFEQYLQNASPTEVDLRLSEKYRNPLQMYIYKLKQFYKDANTALGNVVADNILNEYVRKTIMPVFELGLKYEGMRSDDREAEHICYSRRLAGTYVIEKIMESDYTRFILDINDEQNVPYVSKMLELIWEYTVRPPLTPPESLSEMFTIIRNIVGLPLFNPHNIYHRGEQGIQAQYRRNTLISLMRRIYTPRVQLYPKELFKDWSFKNRFDKEVMEGVLGLKQ